MFSLGVWICLPKCPVCVAAHVALWTGLGISLAQASVLRWTLLLSSVAVLAWLVLTQTRAVRSRKGRDVHASETATQVPHPG